MTPCRAPQLCEPAVRRRPRLVLPVVLPHAGVRLGVDVLWRGHLVRGCGGLPRHLPLPRELLVLSLLRRGHRRHSAVRGPVRQLGRRLPVHHDHGHRPRVRDRRLAQLRVPRTHRVHPARPARRCPRHLVAKLLAHAAAHAGLGAARLRGGQQALDALGTHRRPLLGRQARPRLLLPAVVQHERRRGRLGHCPVLRRAAARPHAHPLALRPHALASRVSRALTLALPPPAPHGSHDLADLLPPCSPLAAPRGAVAVRHERVVHARQGDGLRQHVV